MITAVGMEVLAPIHAFDFDAQSFPIDRDDDEVIRIIAGVGPRSGKMFKADFRILVSLDILMKVRLARVRVQGRPTSAREDLVEAISFAPLRVSFNPVFKEMFVTGEQDASMVLVEQRHVPLPDFCCGDFHPGAAVRA